MPGRVRFLDLARQRMRKRTKTPPRGERRVSWYWLSRCQLPNHGEWIPQRHTIGSAERNGNNPSGCLNATRKSGDSPNIPRHVDLLNPWMRADKRASHRYIKENAL